MQRDVLLLCALAGVLPLVGCNRKPDAPAAGGAASAAPKVEVVTPAMRPVKRDVEQPGTVQAFEETALHAKFPGFVGSIEADPEKKDRPPHDRFIDIGSRVKAGQVLARLAVPELDEELLQKKALVEQAQAEVVQAEKAEAAAKSAIDGADALADAALAGVERADALGSRWEKEVERVRKLVEGSMTDSQTLDEVRFQFLAAEAGRKEAGARLKASRAAVEKARADHAKSAADVTAANARLAVAKADQRRTEALVGYKEIKAPFDGIVTRRAVNTGDLVTGGEKAGLFTVAKVNPVRVVVNVPEADAGLVNAGQDVRLTLQGTGAALPGKITRTSWSLEPGSRTLRAEIDVPNEKGDVRPGMYAYAKLTAELPAAWSVPAAAVGKINDEPVVYLVEGGKAVRTSVQLGRGDSQFTQLRRYKKTGASEWAEFTGAEKLASPAASLNDGQAIP